MKLNPGNSLIEFKGRVCVVISCVNVYVCYTMAQKIDVKSLNCIL